MTKTISPEKIALELVQQWNQFSPEQHQLIYDDQVELTCSLLRHVVGEPAAKLKGRHTLMAYWQLMRSRFPDLRMIHHRSDWHGNQIMMELSMPPLSQRVLGLISLNQEKKITRLRLSHV